MNTLPFIKVDDDKCIGCGACAEECPFEAIVIENNIAKILETCSGCLTCLQLCPSEALSESKDSPRAMIQKKYRLSKEQLQSAAFGPPFSHTNIKKQDR